MNKYNGSTVMWQTLAFTLVPVTIPIIIGYAWARAGRPLDSGAIGPLVSDVSMPCLIFATLAKADIAPRQFLDVAFAAFLCLILLTMVGMVIAHPIPTGYTPLKINHDFP
jgi:predicted permease